MVPVGEIVCALNFLRFTDTIRLHYQWNRCGPFWKEKSQHNTYWACAWSGLLSCIPNAAACTSSPPAALSAESLSRIRRCNTSVTVNVIYCTGCHWVSTTPWPRSAPPSRTVLIYTKLEQCPVLFYVVYTVRPHLIIITTFVMVLLHRWCGDTVLQRCNHQLSTHQPDLCLHYPSFCGVLDPFIFWQRACLAAKRTKRFTLILKLCGMLHSHQMIFNSN